eukprot:766326-Hanusia_phi.AAC.2
MEKIFPLGFISVTYWTIAYYQDLQVVVALCAQLLATPDLKSELQTLRSMDMVENWSGVMFIQLFSKLKVGEAGKSKDSTFESTKWISDSSIRVQFASGTIISTLSAKISLGIVAGSASQLYSFDRSRDFWINGSIVNFPQIQLNDVVQVGFVTKNMGHSDSSARMTWSKSQCESTAWISESSVKCKRSSGVARSISIILTSCLVGTITDLISIDGAVLSTVISSNVAVTGAQEVRLLGSGVALWNVSPSSRLSATAAEYTKWKSETSVLSQSCSGYQQFPYFSVVISVVSHTKSLSDFLTYDSSALSSTKCSNVPSTGSLLVTVFGSGFSSFEASLQAAIHQTDAEFTDWRSDTSVCTKIPSGNSRSRSVAISHVLQSKSTFTYAFSFDGVVLFSKGTNFAATGSQQFTVKASGLTGKDSTFNLKIGFSSSESSSWVSDSSLSAKHVRGSMRSLQLSQSNTRSQDSFLVSVYGTDFGNTNPTLFASIQFTTPECTIWISDTFISTRTVPMTTRTSIIVLSVESSISTLTESFSADCWSLSSIEGNFPIFAQLIHFAIPGLVQIDYLGTVTAKLGSTTCESSEWASTDQIVCKISRGVGKSKSVSVSYNVARGTISDIVSYDIAALSSGFKLNAGLDRTMLIEIFGFHFGSYLNSPHLRIGITACESSSWVSTTSVLCAIHYSVGRTHKLHFTSAMLEPVPNIPATFMPQTWAEFERKLQFCTDSFN